MFGQLLGSTPVHPPYSQGAGRTKVHVYLPYRGAISFYVYIVPLGLINIFLYVGLLPTRFLFKFPYKTINVKKGKISNSFIGKTTCVIGKAIKKLHMTYYFGYFDFESFC